MMIDPFGDPGIAADMTAVVGVRFVCGSVGCDWLGWKVEGVCPKCGHPPIDRWLDFAREAL